MLSLLCVFVVCSASATPAATAAAADAHQLAKKPPHQRTFAIQIVYHYSIKAFCTLLADESLCFFLRWNLMICCCCFLVRRLHFCVCGAVEVLLVEWACVGRMLGGEAELYAQTATRNVMTLWYANCQRLSTAAVWNKHLHIPLPQPQPKPHCLYLFSPVEAHHHSAHATSDTPAKHLSRQAFRLRGCVPFINHPPWPQTPRLQHIACLVTLLCGTTPDSVLSTMKLFVDSTDIDEIKEAAGWGVVDGCTTNPCRYWQRPFGFKEQPRSRHQHSPNAMHSAF